MKRIVSWLKNDRWIVTKHTNISFFEDYGLAIIFQPHFSLYILIGFIGFNMLLDRNK